MYIATVPNRNSPPAILLREAYRFDEEDLYAALDWLAKEQTRIENRLYESYLKRSGQSPALVLYDVTSS